ncbi:MAG: TraB/GumN family protein [Thermoplasmatota archaeon]
MQVKIGDNIVLVGTAHVSKDSVNEVRSVIEEYKPDVVAVELCEKRYDTLVNKDKWENTPVTALIRENRAYIVLAQTFLASIQRRLGKEYGVEPGSEMIAAIDEAKKKNLRVALIDRDISVTLKRAWRKMGFREKTRLAWEFMKALVGYDEEELEDIDLKELMKEDVISAMMKEFGEIAPGVTDVLIHERDEYIAKKILDESKNGKVVAVVGAGHLNGIKECLEKKELKVDLKNLETVPKKLISLSKVIAVAIPTIFFGIIIWLIITRGPNAFNQIGNIFLLWFLIHGALSALGAAIAMGHPLSIATAFLAATFTSLEPFFAPGWFAGLVEAKLRPPRIKDFQEISKIEGLRDFWRNKVIRLLMLVALANLGSMIGTFIAVPLILSIGLSG